MPASRLAEIAVREAEKSKNNGTFGVGGLLVDDRGAIVKVIGNRVIHNGSVHDPTAHVERQLVDWYYSSNYLPAPGRMTSAASVMPSPARRIGTNPTRLETSSPTVSSNGVSKVTSRVGKSRVAS